MLVDIILDRKAGERYNAREMYLYCQDSVFPFYRKVAEVMRNGTEEQIKELLCSYIKEEMYNPNICDYINSVNWLN